MKILARKNYKDISSIKEVSLMSTLEHKNVVKLYYAFENSDFFFLVMELMKGDSLKKIIIDRYKDAKRKVLFTDEECAMIMSGIFEGVEYLHNMNIIHSDIKPDNILLLNKNDLTSVKIGDFGVSKQTEFRTTEYCGTYIFMAPELLKKKAYTNKVDTWAIGITMYILGSGGEHPIYCSNMSRSVFEERVKNINKTGWTFNRNFPILQRNLFMKLCQYNEFDRLELCKALIHPWVTRNPGVIPLTYKESVDLRYNLGVLRKLIGTVLFFIEYKRQNPNEFEKEKTNLIEDEVCKFKSLGCSSATEVTKANNLKFNLLEDQTRSSSKNKSALNVKMPKVAINASTSRPHLESRDKEDEKKSTFHPSGSKLNLKNPFDQAKSSQSRHSETPEKSARLGNSKVLLSKFEK